MPQPHSPTPQLQSARQVVQVFFDRAHLRLALRPSSVVVRPGDVLVWHFDGLPEDFLPGLRFTPDTGSDPAGAPVDSLTRSLFGLWGTVAATGTYGYRATIQARYGFERDDEPASFFSARAEVVVGGAASEGELPSVHAVEVLNAGGELEVQPENVGIFAGDQVVWRFAPEILEGYGGPLRPQVQFMDGPSPGVDFQLGPFTGLTFQQEGGGGARITGTGYAANPQGSYHYRVQAIREQTGEVVWASGPDPTIDDEGPPP